MNSKCDVEWWSRRKVGTLVGQSVPRMGQNGAGVKDFTKNLEKMKMAWLSHCWFWSGQKHPFLQEMFGKRLWMFEQVTHLGVKFTFWLNWIVPFYEPADSLEGKIYVTKRLNFCHKPMRMAQPPQARKKNQKNRLGALQNRPLEPPKYLEREFQREAKSKQKEKTKWTVHAPNPLIYYYIINIYIIEGLVPTVYAVFSFFPVRSFSWQDMTCFPIFLTNLSPIASPGLSTQLFPWPCGAKGVVAYAAPYRKPQMLKICESGA